MIIKSIEITNFRNIEHAVVEFSDHLNLVVGRNASGKTNFLEALFFLLSGRSLRGVKEDVLIKNDAQYFRLAGMTEGNGGESKIEIGFDRDGRKRLAIDEIRAQKMSKLMELSAVVSVISTDVEIASGPPDLRRKFLDSLLSQCYPTYLMSLSFYNKVLKQKNSLLKEEGFDQSLLRTWNRQLVEYGSEIIRLRKSFVDFLSVRGVEIYGGIFGERQIEISYSCSYADDDKDAVKENLQKDLDKRARRERRLGYSVVGPHRDDIEIAFEDKKLREYGSRGQQRCAMLAMKFSALEYIERIKKEKPLLILDEAVSELDEKRSVNLLNVSESIGQVTMASAHGFEGKNGGLKTTVIKIEDGKITQ